MVSSMLTYIIAFLKKEEKIEKDFFFKFKFLKVLITNHKNGLLSDTLPWNAQ